MLSFATFRRRPFLWSSVGLILGLGLWAVWIEPATLRVHHERFELPFTAPKPLRILAMADLHVGSPFNGLARLRRLVDRANDTAPDIVCILGDLVIHEVPGGTFVPPEDIAAELRRLRAGSGVFAVLGNHDNWFNHDRTVAALRANGITVLEDTATKVSTSAGPFWIGGITDLWTGRADIDRVMRDVTDSSTPLILMTHNPDLFPRVPPRALLTLAGHTHGGQVNLPFVGRLMVPSQFGQRYAGGHIVEQGRHLFVTTGVGTSILPVRFGVPASIVAIELVPQTSGR